MSSPTVRVYFAFEFERDGGRRGTIMGQSHRECAFNVEDKSLPHAVHNERWRREASRRIRESDVVVVLLGQDTHNAPGVMDEVNLARQWERPIVQLMPQGKNYGLVSDDIPVCRYKWPRINEMMRNPRAFRGN